MWVWVAAVWELASSSLGRGKYSRFRDHRNRIEAWQDPRRASLVDSTFFPFFARPPPTSVTTTAASNFTRMQRGRRLRPPRFEDDWRQSGRASGRPPRSGGLCGRATNVCLSMGRLVGRSLSRSLLLSWRGNCCPVPCSFLWRKQRREGGREGGAHKGTARAACRESSLKLRGINLHLA